MQKQRRRPLHYFTLVELLVAIGVITVLAALLLPALRASLEQARRVVDVSNRKQCGMTLINRASEHNGRLPEHPSSGQFTALCIKGGDGPPLVDSLSPYLDSFDVWTCNGVPPTPLIDSPLNTRSYSYCNVMYFAGRTTPDFGLGHRTPNQLSHRDAKSSMPLVSCVVRYVDQGPGKDFWTTHAPRSYPRNILSNSPSRDVYVVPALELVPGMAITFMDGHSQWVRMEDLEAVGNCQTGKHWKTYAVLP